MLLWTTVSPDVEAEVRIYFMGGLNLVQSSGSEGDYQVGVDEFPLCDAHNTAGFGFGLNKSLGVLYYGAEVFLNASGSATLNDPSDGDTVKISTSRYAVGQVLLGGDLFRSSGFRFFMEGGGGVGVTMDKDTRTYTSAMGAETVIGPPDREFPLTLFAGTGCAISMSEVLDFRLTGRYRFLFFDQPQSMWIFSAGLGVTF
jgi:hypothetical protein